MVFDIKPIDIFIKFWRTAGTVLKKDDPDFANIKAISGWRWERTWPELEKYGVDELVALMDECGIEKVGTANWKFHSFHTDDFLVYQSWQSTAEAVAKYPDRIFAYFGIDPTTRMAGVRELEMAVKEYGFKGAHIFAACYDKPLNDRDWYPFYAKCEELGVPVGMCAGQQFELHPNRCQHPSLIDDIALYFPGLKIVATHYGWPWEYELMALAQKHLNVYIGTAGIPPKRYGEEFIKFLNTWGKGKAMWCTTWPSSHWDEEMSQLAKLPLTEDAKRTFLHDTAVKVFDL